MAHISVFSTQKYWSTPGNVEITNRGKFDFFDQVILLSDDPPQRLSFQHNKFIDDHFRSHIEHDLTVKVDRGFARVTGEVRLYYKDLKFLSLKGGDPYSAPLQDSESINILVPPGESVGTFLSCYAPDYWTRSSFGFNYVDEMYVFERDMTEATVLISGLIAVLDHDPVTSSERGLLDLRDELRLTADEPEASSEKAITVDKEVRLVATTTATLKQESFVLVHTDVKLYEGNSSSMERTADERYTNLLTHFESGTSRIKLHRAEDSDRADGYITLTILPNDADLLAARVSLNVRSHVVDEEWFSDETRDDRFNASETLDSFEPKILLKEEIRVGGEVRVELTVSGQLLSERRVQIVALALLFEGVTEDTTDLDGTKFAELIVNANQAANLELIVRNDDEGGDSAWFRIDVQNEPIA